MIRAVVTVGSGAPLGATLTRKLTVRSPADATMRDTVRFTTRRI